MLALKESDIVFSSYNGINAYKVEMVNENEDTYLLKDCIGHDIYYGVRTVIFYNNKSVFCSYISDVIRNTFSGNYAGSQIMLPVDYILENSDVFDPMGTKAILLLIYPNKDKYSFKRIIDIINRDNAVELTIELLKIVRSMHEEGLVGGGFSKDSLLVYGDQDKRPVLLLGPNAMQGRWYQDEKWSGTNQYVTMFAKSLEREKYLGIPRNCRWERLSIIDYAKASDIYTILILGLIGLTGMHPFQGSVCDGIGVDEIRQEIFQLNPGFVFEATADSSNKFGHFEEEKQAIERWEALPEALRKKYHEMFQYPHNWEEVLNLDEWISSFEKL